MVLLHLGFSCLLLFTTSAFMHVLRDIFGDVLGLLMLALCVWSIPGTIEVACTLGVLLVACTLGVLLVACTLGVLLVACTLGVLFSAIWRHHRGPPIYIPRSANSIYVSVHAQIYMYIYVYM